MKFNYIRIIENIDHLKLLEELYLEGNLITVIEGLSTLHYLKRLELG